MKTIFSPTQMQFLMLTLTDIEKRVTFHGYLTLVPRFFSEAQIDVSLKKIYRIVYILDNEKSFQQKNWQVNRES